MTITASPNHPMVALGDVLRRIERFEAREDLEVYPFAGTYSFARGIFVSEAKQGSTFKLPKIQRIREGDFVYSKIMAWEGAFGLVPAEAHGCVMSGAFVVYEPDKTQVEPKYLAHYFKLPHVWRTIGAQSTGTNIRRRSLHPKQFEAARIPLPSLPEQRRIVARIEELVAKIEEARGLRRQIAAESEALRRALIFGSTTQDSTPTKMNELIHLRSPDVSVVPHETYHFAGVYSFGRGVFRGDTKTGMEFAYPRLTRVFEGNFVYPKLMAWEGSLGVVPHECDGLVVSPEFPVFEVDESKVLPETLDVYFRTPSVWPQLSGTSTGTNVRRRRLNPKTFLAYEFPLPSMAVQEQLRKVTKKLNPLSKLQDETAAELDALLPSVLDRAFKGQL